MKTRLFILGLLMSLALGVSAREYVKGEKVYVNVKQSDAVGDWSKAGAKLFLYFYQSWASDTKWLQLTQVEGDIYAVTMENTTPYDRVLVVRKSSSGTGGNWDNIWNQSKDITIPDNNTDITYLEKFYDNGTSCGDCWSWKNYSPSVSQIKNIVASQTAETMTICPQAVNDPISLKAKLKADKSDYEYSNVKGHGWYQSKDGNTWTSIDGYAGHTRDGEGDVNIMHTIQSGVKYYYLHSNKPAGRRLIQVVEPTTGCELDCEITSFETAISAVNADDNTYTLDGMVAFGKANGKLVIECDGKSVTINTPVSPQSFSLHGVPAATEDGKMTTAKAYFTGDPSACSKTIDIKVPNATEAVKKVELDSLTGLNFVLTPKDVDPANTYVWLVKNEKTGVTDTVKGAPQTLTVSAFSTDSTLTYTYKEYYPAAGSMEDMMENGSYEEDNSDGKYGEYGKVSKISEYNYWGYFNQTGTIALNFYENKPAGINPSNLSSNGFAVIRNAHNFAPSYATVKAREGSNFALFDAVPGAAGGNKKAWYATSANNTKLKLQKGTTYVLSFWAANINNYGEMDNAARFVFRIEYNGHTWESGELDLGKTEFRNNIWHQHSETFYAEEDCDNVTISVVNKNTNKLIIGNDFALDDIQFHPISSVSKVVKSQQQFVVTAHEPKVDVFTATVQPVACDGSNYTIAMHVVYQNPKGQLIIKDITTGTEYPYDLPAVAFDTQATLDKNIVITTKEATHEWEAYFADWTTAKKTATTIIPGFPAIEAKNFSFSAPTCTDVNTTLTFDLDYTYQQGDLTFWVDGLDKQTATYDKENKAKQTLAGLTFADIPADGKDNHVLHVSFDGPNSCVKDYPLPAVPFSPVIDKLEVQGLPTTKLSCSTEEYAFNVVITTHYDATGHDIALHFDDNGTAKDTVVAATGTKTSVALKLHNMDDAAQTITVALVEAPTCTKTVDYTPPTLARITPLFDVTVGQTACDVMEYTLSGTVAFDMPDGKLIVEYDAAHRDVITVAAGSTSATFSITGMTATDPGMVLKAWFENSNTPACTVDSKPFEAPVIPTIEAKNFSFSAPGCTDVNTTLTFDLDYTYQQGNLTYWVDGLDKQTEAFTPQDPSLQTLAALTFADIPADGKDDHVLHVSFDGPNSCVKDYPLPAVPFSPVIDAVTLTAVPTLVPCDATAYEITVAVTPHYSPVPAGKTVVLTYDSIGETKTTAPIAIENFPYNLIIHNIANANHSIFAAFADAPDCKTEATYDAPTREKCECDTATICEGEKYWWHEAYRSGPVGENRFRYDHPASVGGYDSLYLFVKERPTISIGTIAMTCDNANEVRIPFSVVKGQPDNFDIDIVGTHYAGTLDIVGTDTAFVFTPATIEAGDYAAHVTIGETEVPCTSEADIHFTIALSGQMYSKWSDVLFIGNKEGRFTAYQWYADGEAMSGETLQRLYDPEGLSGSTILYHCRLTTTDGKTLYTCPQTFDEVTPSRTVPTPNAVQSTKIYDTMGRTINGTPHNGIYIIVEILEDGSTQARKINVYE